MGGPRTGCFASRPPDGPDPVVTEPFRSVEFVTASRRPMPPSRPILLVVAATVPLAVALTTPSPWQWVEAAMLVGLSWTVWALTSRIRDQWTTAVRRHAEVLDRAAKQHRWTLRTHPRGGDTGRAVFGHPKSVPGATPPAAVAVARTEPELATLLRDRNPGWHWAAFGSVLVQRRAAVQSRLDDVQHGRSASSGYRTDTARKTAELAWHWAEQLSTLVNQVEQAMLDPELQAIFDESFDTDGADPDTVLRAAHHLMDLHDALLELAENCRGLIAPPQCRDLLDDLGELIDIPLAGYRRFIDDFVAMLTEIAEVVRVARGPVVLDPIPLNMQTDDTVMKRFFQRLHELLNTDG